MKKEYTIVNLVEIDGKVLNLEELPPEQRKQLALKWQDKIMQPAGYIRKTATERPGGQVEERKECKDGYRVL